VLVVVVLVVVLVVVVVWVVGVVKVKKGKVCPVHGMRRYKWSRGVAPLILNLGIR
jgi:hypothetical protein